MNKYKRIAVKIAHLVKKKNKAYGDSFIKTEKILKLLFPNGIPLDKYDNLLTIVRILDKLFRIATDEKAMQEDPYQDIAGYALLALAQKGADK